ncbi:MAG: DUF2956 domain-containing protein [Candidatus Thiodiazotropha sp. (ex Myrtea sp. 'scaly one' KF741663)]|nr:DUF2956 domain-containing protein [Candidatus Thiodiazotropha sp. (ex Myrtea sp. 'scaly one' KF741663)]
MARNNRQDKPSEETVAEAMRIAKANQRPGQAKEQTKLIAQGIQKGIDQYKKQQKIKAREMDKRRKKNVPSDIDLTSQQNPKEKTTSPDDTQKHNKLPWVLLLASWLGFALYLFPFGH